MPFENKEELRSFLFQKPQQAPATQPLNSTKDLRAFLYKDSSPGTQVTGQPGFESAPAAVYDESEYALQQAGMLPQQQAQTTPTQEKEQNPFNSFAKSAWNTFSYQLPSSLASAAATGPAYEALSNPASPSGDDYYIPEIALDEMGNIPNKVKLESRKNLLNWAINRQQQGQQFSEGLIQRLEDIHSPLDALNWASAALGQGVAQIPAAVASGGLTSMGQEVGSIYLDSVTKIADEKGMTPEEVIDKGLDDSASAFAFGIAAGLLDRIGAGKVLDSFGKKALQSELRKKVKDVLIDGVLIEGVTEGAQTVLEQVGTSKGADKTWEQALKDIDVNEILDSAAAGAVAGGGMSSVGAAFSGGEQEQQPQPVQEPIQPQPEIAQPQPAQEAVQPVQEAIPEETPSLSPERINELNREILDEIRTEIETNSEQIVETEAEIKPETETKVKPKQETKDVQEKAKTPRVLEPEKVTPVTKEPEITEKTKQPEFKPGQKLTRQDVVKQVESLGLPKEQSAAQVALFDARAEAWSRETGRPAEEWFTEKIAGVQRSTSDKVLVQSKTPNILKRDSENAPTFYSNLRKTIEQKMPNKADANTVRGIVKNIKKEELEWTGLDEYLKENSKVTKDEVLQYLDENQVRLEETVKGVVPTEKLSDGRWKITDSENLYVSNPRPGVYYVENKAGQTYGKYDTLEGALKSSYAVDTKFSEYQLPGGENYKETLLRLPEDEVSLKPLTKDRIKLIEISKHDFTKQRKVEIYVDGKRAGVRSGTYQTDDQIKNDFIDGEIERRKTRAKKAGRFVSSHFDEPNILAHIRHNDRTAANGDKVLFLEEIQSDWGQSIRKAEKLSEDNPYKSKSTPPNMPFKNTWHELAFRRMVREAAEKGYDRIAWTTGEQQAERYDLSKQVESITAVKGKAGISITATTSDGRNVIDSKFVQREELPDLIGKELAEKIDAQTESEKSYTGTDLKVGSEGMKGFYDKILVNYANKFGKKFGARVEDANISETTVHSLPITDKMRQTALGEGFPLFQSAKGAVEFLAEDNRVIIHAFESADISTLAHESGHIFRRELSGNDLQVAENWAGVKDGNWTVEAEEKFARGFERYLASGKAPNKELRTVFEQFKQWLIDIYRGLKGSQIDIRLGKDIREVFDNLLGGKDTDSESKEDVRINDDGELVVGDQSTLFQSGTQTDTPAFKKWFGDSKVVENDKPRLMYRGDYRADKIGDSFKIVEFDEGGSGGIYFTSDPELASGYSTNKPYSDDFYDNVLDNTEVTVNGRRVKLNRANLYLNREQKLRIRDAVLTVGEVDDGVGINSNDPMIGRSTWDDRFPRNRSDYVLTADDILIKSGTLDVDEYLRFWRELGIFKSIIFDAPDAPHSGVTPVFLKIENPLNPAKISKSELQKFEKMIGKDDGSLSGLRWARENNQPATMTFVTPEFRAAAKKLGYDGIVDVGGLITKGDKHDVYIAFEPTQIKSAIGNRGTFDPDNPNILFQGDVEIERMKDQAKNFVRSILGPGKDKGLIGILNGDVKNVSKLSSKQVAMLESAAVTISDYMANDPDVSKNPLVSRMYKNLMDVLPVAPKNESLKMHRKMLGLNELNSPQRKSWEESISDAVEKKIPYDALNIARKIIAHPEPLTDEETAGLSLRMAELKNDYSKTMVKISDEKDEVALKSLSAKAKSIEQDFDELSMAMKLAGTEAGRALASRKLNLNEDYNLISVVSMAKASKGKELTRDERGYFERKDKAMKNKDAEIARLKNEIDRIKAVRSLKGSNKYKKMSKSERQESFNESVKRAKKLLAEGCTVNG